MVWELSSSRSLNRGSFDVQRSPEKPCLNDVTEVGTWRKAALGVAIFLVLLTLLPVWDELAEELGIGLVTTFWFLESGTLANFSCCRRDLYVVFILIFDGLSIYYLYMYIDHYSEFFFHSFFWLETKFLICNFFLIFNEI